MKHYKEKHAVIWTTKQKEHWSRDVAEGLREMIKDQYGYRADYKFAADIGISQGSLSDLLNGHSLPAAYTLVKMADVLGTTVGEILKGY